MKHSGAHTLLKKEASGLMKLPPKLVRSLCQATCDKTELDRKALHFRKCFLEVCKVLEGGKDKKKP